MKATGSKVRQAAMAGSGSAFGGGGSPRACQFRFSALTGPVSAKFVPDRFKEAATTQTMYFNQSRSHTVKYSIIQVQN